MLSSPLKSVVGSLPTVSEPNGSQPRSAPSLAMLKLNKTIFSPLQVAVQHGRNCSRLCICSSESMKVRLQEGSEAHLTGNGKELSPRQETTATAVSRRELIGLAATTLGGLSLFGAEPAEALEVADIGNSIKELFGFFKGKPKTGADNQKKPNSRTDDKKPKMEGHGNKPKIEVDEKKTKNGDYTKASAPHHSEKEKVSSSSAAALTLPNILNNIVP